MKHWCGADLFYWRNFTKKKSSEFKNQVTLEVFNHPSEFQKYKRVIKDLNLSIKM